MTFKNYNHAWINWPLHSAHISTYKGYIHTQTNTQTIHRIKSTLKSVSSDCHKTVLSRSYCLSIPPSCGGRTAGVRRGESLSFQLNLCLLSKHVGKTKEVSQVCCLSYGVLWQAAGRWCGHDEGLLRVFSCRCPLWHRCC